LHCVSSNSLTVHGDLNKIIVDSCHMFIAADRLTCVNVGGCHYKVVPKHGSPFGLDGQCVGHAFMLVAYMCSIFLWSMYLFHMHGSVHSCIGAAMWK